MQSRVARSTLAVAALTLAIALGGCGAPTRERAIPEGSTVVALGDSLTYGTGATPDASYPATLATLTGWEVINGGVPGETAAEGCARLPALLEDHQPALVLVLLGGNDLLRRMPEQGITDALQRCVESARAAKARIALIFVPRFGTGGIANAPLYEAAGRTFNVPVIESGLAELLARSAMRADPVHLNAAGYREMANTVAESLRVVGLLAR